MIKTTSRKSAYTGGFTIMITEKLLFAVHIGYVANHRAGIIMTNHSLPIACSHIWDGHQCGPQVAVDGIYALWESLSDVEEFFEHLDMGEGIESGCGSDEKPNGLYVYEVSYPPDGVGKDEDDETGWSHLQGGDLRRPTIDELEPLTRGQAPWGGIVL